MRTIDPYCHAVKMNWMAYNDLAWTDDILAPPETYEEEALFYVEAIKSHISAQNVTILHLYDQYLFEDGEYKLKMFIGTLTNK